MSDEVPTQIPLEEVDNDSIHALRESHLVNFTLLKLGNLGLCSTRSIDSIRSLFQQMLEDNETCAEPLAPTQFGMYQPYDFAAPGCYLRIP